MIGSGINGHQERKKKLLDDNIPSSSDDDDNSELVSCKAHTAASYRRDSEAC